LTTTVRDFDVVVDRARARARAGGAAAMALVEDDPAIEARS
jgi:hypothetical protein